MAVRFVSYIFLFLLFIGCKSEQTNSSISKKPVEPNSTLHSDFRAPSTVAMAEELARIHNAINPMTNTYHNAGRLQLLESMIPQQSDQNKKRIFEFQAAYESLLMGDNSNALRKYDSLYTNCLLYTSPSPRDS